MRLRLRPRRRTQLRRLTLSGRLMLVATLVSGLALINRAATPWLAMLLVAWSLHWIAGWLNRPRLSMRVAIDPELQVGRAQTVELQIIHWGKIPLRQAYLTLHTPGASQPLTWMLQIPGRGSADARRLRLHGQFTPQHRGYASQVVVHVESRYPFGWLRWWQHESLDCPTWCAPQPMADGLALHASAMGETDEVDLQQLLIPPTIAGSEQSGVREYVPGMHVRRWHQAAWARTQIPTILEFSMESGPELQMVVVPPDRPSPNYEQTLSAIMDYIQNWEQTGENEHFRLTAWTEHGWQGSDWNQLDTQRHATSISATRLLSCALSLEETSQSTIGTTNTSETLRHEFSRLVNALDRSLPVVLIHPQPQGTLAKLETQLLDEEFEVYAMAFRGGDVT